jgi:hypothetical protein
MKKIVFLFMLIVIGKTIFCQDVVIGGINKNRLLTWADFTGKPDKNSAYEANTYWTINYTFDGITFKSDTATIAGFQVKLELDNNKSWVKPGRENASLLKHEQGHFVIGLICQKEMIRQINNTIFLKVDFKIKLGNIFSSTLEKYKLMGLKYDEETNHSKNQPDQDKWDAFFTNELRK